MDRCCVRLFSSIFLVTLIWAQIFFRSSGWSSNSDINLHSGTITENDKVEGVDAIRRKIAEANNRKKMYNEDMFGPLKKSSMILIVQVHSRLVYLQHLIESLSGAKHIDEALVIFSHDIYDEAMNKVIRDIKFCRVMQIFFPYSIETHPDTFPGNDPMDCPRDIGKEKAVLIKCHGAEYPDTYGHYREAKFAQIKHHWWWKLSHVFNHVIPKDHDGLVVLLEEDQYAVEDFIHVLRLMQEKCQTTDNCHFLGLGLHEKLNLRSKYETTNEVKLYAENTNLGLAFTRLTYENYVVPCAKHFCEYDDYNWDWSFNYITNVCNKKQLLAMIPNIPRLFHIGECGTHMHKTECQEDKVILGVKSIIEPFKLYPKSVKVVGLQTKKPVLKKNGGWSDKRDHDLCLNITNE